MPGLARALVQQGKLRPDRAENFARKAPQANTQFIDDLIGRRSRSEPRGHGQVRRRHLRPSAAGPRRASTSSSCRRHHRRKLVWSLRVVALRKRGNRLAVAVSDPTNLQALDQIKFQTRLGSTSWSSSTTS